MSGVLESVRDYVDGGVEGASFVEVHPSETIVRAPPRTLDAQVHPVLAALSGHTHPETFRAVLPGARIVGWQPLVLTRDRRALAQCAFGIGELHANPVMRERLRPRRRLRGPHIAFVAPWHGNHFHWMLDSLPRLALLAPDEVEGLPVIVPADLSPVQLESLALLGIGGDQLVEARHPHLLVDELHWPSLVGGTGNPPTWAVRWLRERLVRAADGPGRRLYVSRADAERRRVANEQEVIELLAGYGFEVIVPAELSLREQIDAFSAATVIVGAHGAGLVNTLAARDATVIEIFDPRGVNGCYYALAEAQGHEYWYVLGRPTADDDVEVELRALGATLEAAGR